MNDNNCNNSTGYAALGVDNKYLNDVYTSVCNRNANQPEFLQSVREVLESLVTVVERNPAFERFNIVRRITEAERFIQFRVTWVDDSNNVRVNRGYRVHFNSALGPYKGGTRFHPSVNSSIMKFLAFEQTFKNSLTGLSMGGGKGGSDFDPRGKSDMEVMRFCQAYMNELYRHIGPDTDVPSGDIGVSGREINYMFGQYKRIKNEFTGVLTGKDLTFGGSLARKEATGYGLCYFTREMLNSTNQTFDGKTVVISGSGNVAIYAHEKANQYGAKVVAMSDSGGYIYDENGIVLDIIKELKEANRLRISEYAKRVPTAKFIVDCNKIWDVPCDIALPCATQNEMDLNGAKSLVSSGCMAVAEGANMPVTPDAVEHLQANRVLFGPAKAANAGGVATSGLEMSQNSARLSWTFKEVDTKLEEIMKNIYRSAYDAAKEYAIEGDLVKGANIAGFLKVAEAMISQGITY